MKKRNLITGVISAIVVLVICINKMSLSFDNRKLEKKDAEAVTEIQNVYRGFQLDNVLLSKNGKDIHYNVYIPDDYDGSKEYALFITLPGYQGLYFQGVGVNLETEEFGFTARNIVADMIIVAPQLDDWGETSVNQVIELTEYFA